MVIFYNKKYKIRKYKIRKYKKKEKDVGSLTNKLKENILSGFMPNVIYGRNDIKEIIQKQTNMVFGVDYQETHFAGSLATLVKKGQLVKVGYGKYQLVCSDKCEEENQEETQEEMDVSQKINLAKESVKEEYIYLKELMNGIKVSWNDDKKNIEDMLLLKEVAEYLENVVFSEEFIRKEII